MNNRTLQFYGYAYGNEPVELTAQIDGQTVFAGPVNTIDSPMEDPRTVGEASILFSVDNSALFPQNFSGSRPMTVTVSKGLGVIFTSIRCNYMDQTKGFAVVAENCSIDGTTLTTGPIISAISQDPIKIGQLLITVPNSIVEPNTIITAGSGTTWTVNKSQTVGPVAIGFIDFIPGDATTFVDCYNGNPTNSEGTPDCRSSVTINGALQVPPLQKSTGRWTWAINSGDTFGYNLNISSGQLIG